MTSCPICQKPVDPIRASHIRVIGGRVIPYCSAACRDADAARAAGPLSSQAAPSAAQAAPAAPAVVQPASEAKSSAVKAPVTEKSAKIDAKAEAKAAKAEQKAEAKNDARADAKADAKPDAKPAAKSESKPEAKNETKNETKPDAKADAKSDAKADAKSDAKADAKAVAKPAAKTETKPDAKSDDKAKPATAAKAEPSSAKPATAVEPAKTVRNADEERDATLVPPAPKSKARLVLIAAVVLAVAGVAIWQATKSEEAPPPPAPKVVEPVKPLPPPPPPTFVPAEANARAVAVLRFYLKDNSPRVRRFAAAALGRTGDAEAIQTLLDLRPTEQMEIALNDIAYGLARAGNEEGVKKLLDQLKSSKRDVKSDAARLLAALKDARAESTLSSLLVLSQFRLGAAEQLARLGNKQAIALLQKLRADDKAPEEDRLRATIALGYAGQAEVAEALRALLTDSRFNVGAAGALAVLHDESARQTLVAQLSIPSLRVSAALSLRRLDPSLDASALLYRVMPDVESKDKDTESIAAAEAVLLLTGPATLAEHD